MSISLNPFRDTIRDPRAEFRRQMGSEPEAWGDPNSSRIANLVNTQLTEKQYNDLFEGDSWVLSSERSKTYVSFRPTEFRSLGHEAGPVSADAKEGLLGTAFKARRSHAHFVLKDEGVAGRFGGNSQRNIAVVEAQGGHKEVQLDLKGGDDKAVLFLDNVATGTIYVNGGKGYDTLEIRAKDASQQYEFIVADGKEFHPDPSKLQIVANSVEWVEEYQGEHRVAAHGVHPPSW